jgi:hypothetical protein
MPPLFFHVVITTGDFSFVGGNFYTSALQVVNTGSRQVPERVPRDL